MGFIEKTEKKFGKFAIQGLSLKLVILQCIIFLLMSFEENSILAIGLFEEKISFLNIGPTHFISDFLLLTGLPVCLPGNIMSFVNLFFGSYILIMCGDALEDLWGRYKFNIFVLTTLILGTITLQLARQQNGVDITFVSIFPASVIKMNILSLLHMSLFIAFAANFPKTEIRAMLILPVTFGFLALIEIGITIFIIFNCPTIPMMAYYLSIILLPTILFHYKMFLERQHQKARTAEFTKKVTAIDKQAFHKCQVCGKTENDGDGIEFRISADGEEYCLEHLK
jgi:hypothetical protein